MTERVNATFEVSRWDEGPWVGVPDEPKLVQAHVVCTYTGGMEGRSRVEYLMAFEAGGAATFVGIERFEGRMGTREGSCVFHHVGRFQDRAAESKVVLLPGAGVGGLAGVSGEGSMVSKHGEPFAIELELG